MNAAGAQNLVFPMDLSPCHSVSLSAHVLCWQPSLDILLIIIIIIIIIIITIIIIT